MPASNRTEQPCRIPRHTFHPKLYLFEWEDHAEIIIGSNNITQGGLFSNYEGSARVRYDLPTDTAIYEAAQEELGRFLDPDGPTTYTLTEEFLQNLITRNEVLTETEIRSSQRRPTKRPSPRTDERTIQESPFGVEDFPTPPPLPTDLLKELLREVRKRRGERGREKRKRASRRRLEEATPISTESEDLIPAAAFYMTLPTLQGRNIPGEARIPLEAIELAQEFWGWPDEYERDESPRSGKNRIYWNWRPRWKVWSVENPKEIAVQPVRMYMYENSSDFRFYVRPLVDAGADLGDVVRIRRIAQSHAEYECVLARRGSEEYETWIKYCTQRVRNSPRRFGYA